MSFRAKLHSSFLLITQHGFLGLIAKSYQGPDSNANQTSSEVADGRQYQERDIIYNKKHGRGRDLSKGIYVWMCGQKLM